MTTTLIRRIASVAIALLFLPVAGRAAILNFNLVWDSLTIPDATATASLSIDDSLVDLNAPIMGMMEMSNWLTSFELTVSGNGSGDGNYSLSDFNSIIINTGGAALDFTKELVGQDLGGRAWGLDVFGLGSGDFNIFATEGSGAPIGSREYVFSLGSNSFQLSSFAPVPEPSTTATLLGLGATALVLIRRRRGKAVAAA